MREFRIIQADVLDGLRQLPDESVHCCVTSPPYWGLRSYGTQPQIWGEDPACEHEWGREIPGRDKPRGNFCSRCGAWRGELGAEPDYRLYVDHIVTVFREVGRVLRDDGTLWLNIGDSYATGAGAVGECVRVEESRGERWKGYRGDRGKDPKAAAIGPMTQANRMPQPGLKPKDLCMIPARVAISLQADGWYLRSDIIWHKPNPMPESVTDRPTKAHEYLFLLSKSERYFYDHEAIKEHGVAINEHDATGTGYVAPGQAPQTGTRKSDKQRGHGRRHDGFNDRWDAMEKSQQCSMMRNKRSVWSIAPAQYREAHFATFPTALVEPCILAGCPEGGTVLDSFSGSGTTGVVALRHDRQYIGIELNPEYVAMSRARIMQDSPLFNTEFQ